ncbi:NTF2-like protein [Microthyrium microscopicum]|uniref:NTF2-like protein n=1 Tax=Microthyrium microscopicum TaxID=703497 RepID=A0A6A6UDV1_9PEZI|nr:NTF2-like protein [Microthyrium microscopicum]
MAINTHASGNGFLTSFNSTTPKLYITAETDTASEFDQIILKRWREEGFDITYLPYRNGGKGYIADLKAIPRNMSVGDSFGIVAYGDAAAACLETFRNPTSRLCALVAYYPSSIPDPQSTFPIGLKVLVHLAGQDVGVTRQHEVLGIQGKRRTTMKKVPEGTGTGGMLKLAYPSFTYDGVEPGFAEHDLEEYDKISERISWGRSLDCVRKAFRTETNLEQVWEDHCKLEFKTKDADKVMTTMVDRPYVNHVPTMTGGIGQKDLHRFYRDYFIPDNPPSLKMKLISRTVGVDKVVDELLVSFDHTQDISWMLPGVPPTNKHVEVALVAVVCVRGGKLYHEHIYWDQATVLVQLGLLDPKYIPPKMKHLGINRLPVVGAEGARKVLDESSEPSNKLMDDW